MDLTKHLIDYNGRPYLPVVWRVVDFRQKYPNHSIFTQITINDNFVLARADILDDKGRVLSQAHKTKPLNDKDAIAKAETGALGRALSFFGIGTELAVQDLEEGDEIVHNSVKETTKTVDEQINKSTPALKALNDTIKGLPNSFKPSTSTNKDTGLKKASPAQIKRLWAVAKEKNLSNNDVFRMLQSKFNLTQVEDLDWKQYKDFVDEYMQNIESISEEINSTPPQPGYLTDEIPF